MFGNDQFTIALLHLDGANGGTTFTDNNAGGTAKTWTAAGTSPTTSTTNPKFGTASGSFPGGGWISTPETGDFDFGTGNFTIDWWIKRGSLPGSQVNTLGQGDSGAAHYNYFAFTAGNVPRFAMNNEAFLVTSGTVTDTTTWHHIAVVRNGNSLALALDGTFGTSADVTGITYAASTGSWSLGRIGDGVGPSTFVGNIDEFRISKGIARWTANFTPPNEPYDVPANPKTYYHWPQPDTDVRQVMT